MTVQKTVNYCCEVGASDMIAQVDLIPVHVTKKSPLKPNSTKTDFDL